jgi:hypothetical protein
MRTFLSSFALLAVLFALPSTAWGQGRGSFRFEEEVIRGEVQKPEVMMVITRQNLNSNYSLELRESFLSKIVESVELKPF